MLGWGGGGGMRMLGERGGGREDVGGRECWNGGEGVGGGGGRGVVVGFFSCEMF